MAVFKKLLVAYDGSSDSKQALDQAAEFMALDRRVETHVVHVTSPPHMDLYSLYGLGMSEGVLEEIAEENEKVIAGAKELLGAYQDVCHFKQLQGDASQKVLDYAEAHEVDLIIIGSRGLGVIQGMFLGSVSSRVVKHSKIHVLVMK